MSDPLPKTLADLLIALFPERRLQVRTGEEVRDYMLTPGRQAIIAVAVAVTLMWMNVAMFSVIAQGLSRYSAPRTTSAPPAFAADRADAPDDTVSNVIAPTDPSAALADKIERRHAALAMLLSEARNDPGALAELQPVFPALTTSGVATPAERIKAVVADQERLVAAASSFARQRAIRLRQGLVLAGLNPLNVSRAPSPLHGALITAHDPRDLAAEMKVDAGFARRVQNAASDLFDLRDLTDETNRLPLAHPVDIMVQSSGFGLRRDPINALVHFHAGLDFPGPVMSTIRATAPGVVVFTGPRGGYGETIEVDHGGGFWTRYAHLIQIGVAVGQRVARGDRIGGMGSTGHSTGNHLHYEVWQNGRAQDPTRFLRAGEFVAHAG